MRQNRTQTVSLGTHWNEFIENKLGEGKYTSTSEIIREGLRLLEEKEKHQQQLATLRQALIEGDQSGYSEFNAEETLAKAKKASLNA